jgi:hypothetical protein
MAVSPTLLLAMRDLRTLVRSDPSATYDALAELVELLTAPSAEPFAKPARNLGLGLQRALDEYAQRCDELAEQPELPLAVGDR